MKRILPYLKNPYVIAVIILLVGVGVYFIIRKKKTSVADFHEQADELNQLPVPDLPIEQATNFDWSKKHFLLANKNNVRVWNASRSGVTKIAKKNEWVGQITQAPKDGWYTALNTSANTVMVETGDVKVVN